MQIMTIYMVKIQYKLQDQFCDIETFTPLLEGCLYSLDWTTGLTFELTFELFFFLSMINIAVVLLAKVNLGVLGK